MHSHIKPLYFTAAAAEGYSLSVFIGKRVSVVILPQLSILFFSEVGDLIALAVKHAIPSQYCNASHCGGAIYVKEGLFIPTYTVYKLPQHPEVTSSVTKALAKG